MSQIQEVTSGPSTPFGDPDENGARMVGWEIVTDDGQSGAVYRKETSKPLEPGMEVVANGTTKKGTKKFKVGSAQFGQSPQGAPSGGGSGKKNEFRDPDQIMRSTALGLAVNYYEGLKDKTVSNVLGVATQFAIYVKTGAHSALSPQGEVAATAPSSDTDEIPF
jgi:hypothetical protein